MQLGVQQQGTFDCLWWEQSLHGYSPYYQTRRPGNGAAALSAAPILFGFSLYRTVVIVWLAAEIGQNAPLLSPALL